MTQKIEVLPLSQWCDIVAAATITSTTHNRCSLIHHIDHPTIGAAIAIQTEDEGLLITG